MPPADCTHLLQRRNITHFLIRTFAYLVMGILLNVCYLKCWVRIYLPDFYMNICELGACACVCKCKEMFKSRMNYIIPLSLFFLEVIGFHH